MKKTIYLVFNQAGKYQFGAEDRWKIWCVWKGIKKNGCRVFKVEFVMAMPTIAMPTMTKSLVEEI